MSETISLVGRWDIQWWLSFDNGTTFLPITEDTAFDSEVDTKSYEPAYKSRKVQPKYVMGRTTTINWDIDIVLPQELQSKLIEHEDSINVPVVVVRTLNVVTTTGEQAQSSALPAKKAAGILNSNPLDGDASNPLKSTGSIVMSEEWIEGTFDSTQKKFTPKVSA